MEESIIVEKLIESVRQFENLYNYRSPQYKDQLLKENTWKKVSEEVEISVEEAKKKWKNLRDTFAKKIKEQKQQERSGSGATKSERWAYFKSLEFLRDTLKPRKTFCSLAQNSADTEEVDSEIGLCVEMDSEKSSEPAPKRRRPGSAKVSAVDQAILDEIAKDHEPKDICVTFGNYVTSELRELNSKQQLWARKRILGVLLEAHEVFE